jgi:hypothetical protein
MAKAPEAVFGFQDCNCSLGACKKNALPIMHSAWDLGFEMSSCGLEITDKELRWEFSRTVGR